MAKCVYPAALDGGLTGFKNSVTQMILIKAYTAFDSYATIMANKVASVAMVPADFTIGSSGNNRTLTTAAKAGVVATADGPAGDHHIAFTDGVSAVWRVTDETGEAVVASGGTVGFPSLVFTELGVAT